MTYARKRHEYRSILLSLIKRLKIRPGLCDLFTFPALLFLHTHVLDAKFTLLAEINARHITMLEICWKMDRANLFITHKRVVFSPGVSSRELRNGRLMVSLRLLCFLLVFFAIFEQFLLVWIQVRGHTADSGLYKEGFPPPLALLRKSGRHWCPFTVVFLEIKSLISKRYVFVLHYNDWKTRWGKARTDTIDYGIFCITAIALNTVCTSLELVIRTNESFIKADLEQRIVCEYDVHFYGNFHSSCDCLRSFNSNYSTFSTITS